MTTGRPGDDAFLDHDLHGGDDGGHDVRDELRRWRLVLGGEAAEATGVSLRGDEARMDRALEALYGATRGGAGPAGRRAAGLGASAPQVARWLGDIRAFFPKPVVQVMQQDAIDRLDLTRLLLEPEMLEAVEPDVHLVGTLLSLNRVMPERARESAREVVRTVVRELERRLAQRTRSAVGGALDRTARTARPRRLADVDWNRTIHVNLRHYQPAHRTVVPARLVGYGRRRQAVQRDVVLCVDQSGSMATSVVYAGVFGAVLASSRRCAPRSWSSTPPSSTSPSTCTTRSSCSSARSSAAAPTSTAPSPTASASSPGRRARSSC
jgi:hypothetical protein